MRITIAQEPDLSIYAFDDGIFWILGKCVLLNHEVMELVSQELSTGVPTMAVIHAEEATLRPVLVLAMGWLRDVEDD